MNLSAQQEAVLSNLLHRAPMGQTVTFKVDDLASDLQVSGDAVRPVLHDLTKRHCIALIDKHGSEHEYRVLCSARGAA